MNEPLDTYDEVRPDGRRRLELYADRVFVKGVASGNAFESVVYLADMRPEPSKLWVRTRLSFPGLLFASIAFALSCVLAANLQKLSQEGKYALIAVFIAIAIASGVTGIKLLLNSFKSIEFARFQAVGGIILLDVANAGPDSSKFTTFVQLVSTQIRQQSRAGTV